MIDQLTLIPLDWSTNLTSPDDLGEGLAMIIMGMLAILPYGGMRLRSPAVFIAWALTVLVLILTIITSLPFIWFWLMIILDVFVVSMASIVYYLIK